MQALIKLGFLVSGLALVGCGHREVRVAHAPARVIPSGVEARTSPPAPGTTRVLLDANGERATVMDIVETTDATATAWRDGRSVTADAHSETQTPVCITPCFSDLKPGLHRLRFTSEDDLSASTASVQVDDTPKVVRHALGRTEPSSLGHILATATYIAGAAVLATGAGFYAAGELSGPDDESARLQRNGMRGISIGLGALLIGIPLAVLTRPTRREGATTELPYTW